MKQINWKAYYEKEADISDFDPRVNRTEMHRCHAAWSVIPSGGVTSILDVGCGDGFFCHWIRRHGGVSDVTGVDISDKRLRRARERYPEIRYVKGAIGSLPFPEKSFDVVTCIEVLEHLPNPVDALVEFGKIARKYVIVTVPDRQQLSLTLCPHCLQTFPTDGHINSFSTKTLTEVGLKAGLSTDVTKIYRAPAGLGNGIPVWLGRLLRGGLVLLKDTPGLFIAARFRV